MITAILLARARNTDGQPAFAVEVDGEPLVSRLAGQLRRRGAGRTVVVTRPEWADAVPDQVTVRTAETLPDSLVAIAEVAERATGGLVLAHADILTHDEALAGLLADPRVSSGVLATTELSPDEMVGPQLRLSRGRVISAESAYHKVSRVSAEFLGVLKVDASDRVAFVDTARELAELAVEPLPEGWEGELADKVEYWGARFFRRNAPRLALAEQLERIHDREKWMPDPGAVRSGVQREFADAVLTPFAALREDAVSLLVAGMAREGVYLSCAYRRELFWDRPFTQERAELDAEVMAVVDEEQVLLDSAVKAKDGFFTTFLVSPYSKYLARWSARRGLTPNQVTAFSMLLGILAAGAFAVGSRPWLVVGALLLQAAFTADCVDGQLARYSRQFSRFGAWLDSVFDRSKEYVVYVGLALGATQAPGETSVWLLAGGALALQVVRHYIDFSYAAEQRGALEDAVRVPLAQPEDSEVSFWEAPLAEQGVTALQRFGRAGIRLSVAFEAKPWMKWAKRIVVLPIGERFLLISVTAAVFDPVITFWALLVWGLLAATYTVVGRMLRSVA